MKSAIVSVKIWGEFALFTRPELKVERMSYPIMTPSAARGILDAILFKPQMRWHVRNITAIRPDFPSGFPADVAAQPYRFIAVRRNEVQDKIAPRTVEGWIKNPVSFQPYYVDSAGRESIQGQHRTQRNTIALHHVAYVVDASPILTKKANMPRQCPANGDEEAGPDSVAKYVAMFNRRVAKGQCFHRPYLGCREFACHFAPTDGSEQPLSNWNESLGLMLYDMQFNRDGRNLPGFFEAKVRGGVLHCDTKARGSNGEPVAKVIGWDQQEVNT